MADNLIVDLPQSVACLILQDWIGWKALATLDSASCCKEVRRGFLKLLESEDLVLQNHMRATNNRCIEWLIRRRVRAQCVVTTVNSNSSLVEKYLFNFGDSISKVVIEHETSREVIGALLAYCHNIRDLELCDDSMRCVDLRRLLTISRHSLAKLSVYALPEDEPLLDEVRVHEKLNAFSMFQRGRKDWAEILEMNKLVRMEILNDVPSDQVVALARMSPNLRSLGLRGMKSLDYHSELKEIVMCCPGIINFDFGKTAACNDAVSLATGFKDGICLQSIDVQGCHKVSSNGLYHLHFRNAAGLRTLHLGGNGDFNPNVFRALLEKCYNLRTLSWVEPIRGPTYAFTDSIRNLRTLVLGGSVISDANLIAIGEHCAELRTLSIYCQSARSLPYTDKGLGALVDGCPQLTLLVVRTDVHAVILKMWRMLRPKLTISDSVESMEKLRYNLMEMPVD